MRAKTTLYNKYLRTNCRVRLGMEDDEEFYQKIRHISNIPLGGKLVERLYDGFADDGSGLYYWPLVSQRETAFRCYYLSFPNEETVVIVDVCLSAQSKVEIEKTLNHGRLIKLYLGVTS